jgi:hypothetical protein
MAYLSQVTVKFDLGEDFSIIPQARHLQLNGEPRRGERVFHGCTSTFVYCAISGLTVDTDARS